MTPEIQKIISDFERFMSKEGIKRPEVKFTVAILTAKLKRHHVHLTVLSRSLEEDITPKKTWERLNRNLSRKDIGSELIRLNLHKNACKIRDFRYCLIDGSDIQKLEANHMEELGRIRDGSKKTEDKKLVIGNGYYWLNGVMVNDEEILSVYSEIYSLEQKAGDHVSEHTKIHEITDMVCGINPYTIFVIDRE